ncbi:MAG TPA: helix-turn-helix domain-containing protein [Gemmatimonadaceae bacterium]|nr:helix-turn-helix domain-containing protein [Gemmatimonadaceae bacterium]
MQQLARDITSAPSVERAAEAVMETSMLLTRTIRGEVRRYRPARLSVSQFRALAFLDAHPDASLSEAAEYLGLTPPSASKLIDGLVRRKLATRRVAPSDRRRTMLRVTARGAAGLRAAFAATQGRLADRLRALTPSERTMVMRAMAVLAPLFAPPEPSSSRLP